MRGGSTSLTPDVWDTSRRVFRQFVWLEVGSDTMALSHLTHLPLTHTVNWLSASRKVSKMFVKLPHGQHLNLDLFAVGQLQAESMQP